MCGSNTCVSAFAAALNSKFTESVARDQLCHAVDYVAYVKLLIEGDIAAGFDTPQPATQNAIAKLINDLNSILSLFKGNGTTNASSALAIQWGLNMRVSCRLVTILIRDCYASSGDANYSLANLVQASPVNYSSATDRSFNEFLCCLGITLQSFASFLSSYTSASGCN